MTMTEKQNEKGLILGCTLLLPLIIVQLAPYSLDIDSAKFKAVNIAFILYLGALFLLSYYYSHKTLLLRGLRWLCENLSWPKSKKMAFFYFGLSLIIGLLATLDATGVLN